jgi:hypothetical protein
VLFTALAGCLAAVIVWLAGNLVTPYFLFESEIRGCGADTVDVLEDQYDPYAYQDRRRSGMVHLVVKHISDHQEVKRWLTVIGSQGTPIECSWATMLQIPLIPQHIVRLSRQGKPVMELWIEGDCVGIPTASPFYKGEGDDTVRNDQLVAMVQHASEEGKGIRDRYRSWAGFWELSLPSPIPRFPFGERQPRWKVCTREGR